MKRDDGTSGYRLDPAVFVPVADPAILERPAPEARPHVRQCALRQFMKGIH